MSKVIIIVNAQVEQGKIVPSAPIAQKMATALTKGIMTSSPNTEVKIMGAADLWSKSVTLANPSSELIYCPLTIKLPEWFNFKAYNVYKACYEVDKRRKWVEQHFNYRTSTDHLWLGDLWLPIIYTAKGIVYGEVIGEGGIPNSYEQPYDLGDNLRQPLYRLAHDLLESVKATPAVYLMQFRMVDENIIFDRLWPFPATPAIASINVQNPDLYTCHWHCLRNYPFTDIRIPPSSQLILN
ncbi:hypothetical protein IQ215_01345 [Cyanobacterium stanieri LEGE 03274]|uniref:Uncharacterized protein n=1 Tax=Cyanobacterium stanieri LEGE 03274 TaxID=1828756 RepID=A0ABR9V0C8_9CHRO|nr:hypothetical protein [Cyanobacterium stanieri]MBE9221330.1 hypothetical protein [Cyanobacterium stanieri LEGE 03274]